MLLTWGSNQGVNALMNSAEFIAGFADKGSGEVDLSLSRGTGSATFTRATTATTVNSSGTIVSVASGTARSYYDPTTLQYMGYLAEGARTNTCLQSADLGTTWSPTSAVVATNQIASPDGGTNADSVNDNSAVATGFVSQDVTVAVDSNTHWFSVFVKQGTASILGIRLAIFGGTGVNIGLAFNPANGEYTCGSSLGSAPASISVKQYPNGWWRVAIPITNNGTALNSTCRIGLYPAYAAALTAPVNNLATNTPQDVSLTGTQYFWGTQFEQNVGFSSTYISTTTTSVTRNADVLTYPVSGNLTDTGSCFAQVSSIWSGTSSAQKWIIYGASGAGNGGPLFLNSSSFVSLADGTAQRPSALTYTGPTSAKLATSWGGSSALAAKDGSVSSSLTYSGTMALGAAFGIGNGFFSGFEFFGTIRNARIWQTQLTASQLQAVTA